MRSLMNIYADIKMMMAMMMNPSGEGAYLMCRRK